MYAPTFFYKCANCSHRFTAQEALCEDWRIPEKSLICPKCEFYLAVEKDPLSKFYVFFLLFIIPFSIADDHIIGHDILVPSLFIAGIAMYAYHSKNPFCRTIETNVIQSKKI